MGDDSARTEKLTEDQLLELVEALSEEQGEALLCHVTILEEEAAEMAKMLQKTHRALSAERLECSKNDVALRKAQSGWQPDVSELQGEVQALEGQLRQVLARNEELEAQLSESQQKVAELDQQIAESHASTPNEKRTRKTSKKKDPKVLAAIDSQMARVRAWQDANLEPDQAAALSAKSKLRRNGGVPSVDDHPSGPSDGKLPGLGALPDLPEMPELPKMPSFGFGGGDDDGEEKKGMFNGSLWGK